MVSVYFLSHTRTHTNRHFVALQCMYADLTEMVAAIRSFLLLLGQSYWQQHFPHIGAVGAVVNEKTIDDDLWFAVDCGGDDDDPTLAVFLPCNSESRKAQRQVRVKS